MSLQFALQQDKNQSEVDKYKEEIRHLCAEAERNQVVTSQQDDSDVVMQLRSEVESLKRENERLRRDNDVIGSQLADKMADFQSALDQVGVYLILTTSIVLIIYPD